MRSYRRLGVVGVLVGLAGAVWAGFLVSAVPGKAGEEKAYADAVTCAAGEPRADCLQTVRATVTQTVIRTSAHSSTFDLRLSGPEPANGVVTMGAAGPLLRKLRDGDEVEATVWRHYVVKVSREGRSQKTTDTPAGGAEMATAWSLSVLAGALFFLGTGGYVLRATRRVITERMTRRIAVPLGIALLAAFTPWFGFFAGTLWGGPWTVAAVWLASLPLCVLLIRRLTRLQDDRGKPARRTRTA